MALHCGFASLGHIAPPAWRVALLTETVYLAITVQFARRQDAELALAALKRAGLDSVDTLLAAGIDRTRQVMTEALLW
jgi:hypothetical protein